MPGIKFTPIQWLTHLGAWAPLAVLLWDLANNNLSVNPIQDITFRTGKPALVLLVLCLACSPLNSLLGQRWAIKLRRPLGVYASLYASMHFLVFVGLDFGFDLGLIYDGIFEKRYALVGFAAFLILVPLALTSTKDSQRRLGKAWKKLHNAIYVAALLAVVHYTWSVKSDIREPLAYGAVVVALLTVRVPTVKRWLRSAGNFVLQGRGRPMDQPKRVVKKAVPAAVDGQD